MYIYGLHIPFYITIPKINYRLKILVVNNYLQVHFVIAFDSLGIFFDASNSFIIGKYFDWSDIFNT